MKHIPLHSLGPSNGIYRSSISEIFQCYNVARCVCANNVTVECKQLAIVLCVNCEHPQRMRPKSICHTLARLDAIGKRCKEHTAISANRSPRNGRTSLTYATDGDRIEMAAFDWQLGSGIHSHTHTHTIRAFAGAAEGARAGSVAALSQCAVDRMMCSKPFTCKAIPLT